MKAQSHTLQSMLPIFHIFLFLIYVPKCSRTFFHWDSRARIERDLRNEKFENGILNLGTWDVGQQGTSPLR